MLLRSGANFVAKLWADESWRAAFILLFVLHVSFFPCIWGNKTLLASARDAASIMPDGAWQGQHRTPSFPKTLDEGVPGYMTEPWFKLIGKQYLGEKNVPLWNPYQAFGMPLAANMEAQPFYPLTVAVSFHLTPRTYNWYILSRLFVAGFCMYLFLRLFVSFVSALTGGVAAMLAGYYILFLTMQQTSVEVILPAALLAGEWLLRKANYSAVVLFAAVIWLVMVGGMPESAFVLLVFLYAYLLSRLVFDRMLRDQWLRRATCLLAGSTAGLLLSAMLLLPFYEFLHISFDLHQPANIGGTLTGLGHDRFDSSIVAYLFPLLFGPTSNTGFLGLRNYFGVTALFLMLVCATNFWSRKQRNGPLDFLTVFSFVCIVAVLLKRYGFAPINTLGSLPLFRLIQFPKYEELIISACVAMLCAVGLEHIARQNVSVRKGFRLLIATLVIALSGLVWAFPHARTEVGSSRLLTQISNWAIGFACLVLALLAACVWDFARSKRTGELDRFPTYLLAVLTLEFLFSYIAPVYYVFNFLPTVASNPYAGAPFIDVLEKATADHNRVFCRDGVLFPDWASAFSLPDIRAVGAMYYKKYFDFLHVFLPVPPDARDGELSNRFNGGGDYYQFNDVQSRRLLQLTSVKYIGTAHPYTEPNPRIEDILRQNAGHLLPGKEININKQRFFLDGEAREALGEHPPYPRLPYVLTVGGPDNDIFHFSFALNPAVYDKTSGDGVGFTIEVKNSSGSIKQLFSRYIDPKHNAAERHWIPADLDLSAYRGQQITLLFSTDAGPKGDTSFDWAAWADFRFPGDPRPHQPFRLMYSGEAQVYGFDDILPRAAIYTHADLANGSKEVLGQLSQPSLDIFKTVVLDRTGLTDDEVSAVENINRGVAVPVAGAAIQRYESQRVDIQASLDRPGILVLNDSDYPGWTVDIDGGPARWFSANYIFRGLLLKAGHHSVSFRYRPLSFRRGVSISCAGLLGLLAWGLIEVRDRRRRLSSMAPERLGVGLSELS